MVRGRRFLPIAHWDPRPLAGVVGTFGTPGYGDAL
jgi:hypothetical protein